MNDLVFFMAEGCPTSNNQHNALRDPRVLFVRAGVAVIDETERSVDIHALQHTFASRLARSGIELVRTQKLLEHTNPRRTAGIYAHLDAEALRRSIEK